MSDRLLPKVMVALVAAASLGATVLLILVVLNRPQAPSPGSVSPGVAASPDDAIPVLYPLPAFSLTERSGAAVALDDLHGKVWIADFIFTRCAGTCPMMSSALAQMRDALATRPGWDRTRLVSITVDPDHDTPEVLREYAQRYNADAEHWLFLTGERAKIWDLAVTGFKLPVGEDALNSKMPIFHSQKFVLIDAAGNVRGYYDGLEEEGRAALVRDVERVMRK